MSADTRGIPMLVGAPAYLGSSFREAELMQ